MKKFVHGGNIYEIKRHCSGDIMDFSANINPFGLANTVKAAIIEAVDGVVHYPDPDGLELKQALAAYYNAAIENITLGNGAVELLYLFMHLTRPQRVLIPVPAFSEYERSARAAGAEIVYYYLAKDDNFQINWTQLEQQLAGVDAVFIGNPNNPTGNLLPQQQLAAFVSKAEQQNCRVIVDESFLDFLPDSTVFTCQQLVTKYPNLFIIHSLTKFYAIPGLRLGFSLASASITSTLHQIKDPWNVSVLAQRAGIVALADHEYQQTTRVYMEAEKRRFYDKLRNIEGLRVYEPTVNFLLLNLETFNITAAELYELLLQQGIIIRDCSNYEGLDKYFVRMAIRTKAENDLVYDSLIEILTTQRSKL